MKDDKGRVVTLRPPTRNAGLHPFERGIHNAKLSTGQRKKKDKK
jgi:hypothetical protein